MTTDSTFLSSSLSFLIKSVCPNLIQQKNPKTLTEILKWIEITIPDFGVAAIKARDFINFLKTMLDNANPGVRKGAIEVLVILRIQIGAGLMLAFFFFFLLLLSLNNFLSHGFLGIVSFVEDLKPALLASITAEFDKVAGETAPAPTKGDARADGPGGDAGGAAESVLDDLFPRVDISARVAPVTLKMADAAWKTREEAVVEVGQILAEVKRIQPSIGELLNALKARLADSNRNLAALAAKVIGQVATAMGPPFEKQVKGILPSLIKVLSDNKPQVRTAATEALDSIVPETGMESLLPHIAEALKPEGPILRKDLLTWLGPKLKADSKVTKEGVSQLLKPLILCLNDRSGDVRKAAQLSFPPVVAVVGYDYVKRQCADESMKSQAQAVFPLLEKCREDGIGVPNAKPAAVAAPSSSSSSSSSSSASSASSSSKPSGASQPTTAASVAAKKVLCLAYVFFGLLEKIINAVVSFLQ